MYAAHTGQSTSYIKDAVTPISQDPTRRLLRSADTTDNAVPRTQTKFGERAFCVAGPSTWNSLPESLRRTDCTQTFKLHPLTHSAYWKIQEFGHTCITAPIQITSLSTIFSVTAIQVTSPLRLRYMWQQKLCLMFSTLSVRIVSAYGIICATVGRACC